VSDLPAARLDYKSVKNTSITTGIGAVLAIVFGVAAFNATVLSNMLASFESGKNTSTAQAEVKRQSEETAALLKQIQGQIKPSQSQKYPQPAPAGFYCLSHLGGYWRRS